MLENIDDERLQYAASLCLEYADKLSKVLVSGGLTSDLKIQCVTSAKFDKASGMLIVITLVDPKYVGRVIGRGGKIAGSIRQIIYSIGKVHNLEVQYKVDAIKVPGDINKGE